MSETLAHGLKNANTCCVWGCSGARSAGDVLESTRVERRRLIADLLFHLALSLVGWWPFFCDGSLLQNDSVLRKTAAGRKKGLARLERTQIQ